MAVATKLTAVILLVCFIAWIGGQRPQVGGRGPGILQGGQGGGRAGGNQEGSGGGNRARFGRGYQGRYGRGYQGGYGGGKQGGGIQARRQRSIEDRHADNSDRFLGPTAESNFLKPTRIRFMSGYLHVRE